MNKYLLFILLCAGSPVFAVEQPVSSSYIDFSEGLNNLSAPQYLSRKESPDLLNVVIDEPVNELHQRNGYQVCGTIPSTHSVTAVFEYSKSDGSRNLIVSDNISIWQTANCVVFTTITTGLSQLDTPSFFTVRDKLWIINGSTHPITWDGTTATSLDGAGTRPNPPNARYGLFWKERVWLARTGTEPSSIYFSELTDDDGTVLDPSVSTNAWSNALNIIYVEREGGSPIYGIKVYRDNLFVFKETGIFRTIYEDDLNINVTKNVTPTGCRFQDTIVEMDDGLLYFVGKDGIYAFDGSQTKRISDNFQSTFNLFKQPFGGEKFKIWDSAVDFAAGTLTNTSTSIVAGAVVLRDGYFGTNLNIGLEQCTVVNGYATDWITSFDGGAELNHLLCTATTTLSGSYDSWMGVAKDLNDTTLCPNGVVSVKKSSDDSLVSSFTITGTVTISTVTLTTGTSYYISVAQSGTGCVDYLKSPIFSDRSKINIVSKTYSGGTSPYQNSLFIDVKSGYYNTGTFISEAYNASDETTWKTFDVDETLNGQSIAYSIRTATSSYNLGLASYSPILSGVQVSTIAANTWAQWKAALTTTDNSLTPYLNSGSLNWLTGSSILNKMSAINYKSKYWLTGSTTPSNSYNDMTLVKSKSPLNSWVPYDLPLSAFTIWNNNLYAGLANTNTIARMDYGSNDNGIAITSYWTSKDEIYDNPVSFKTIPEIIADYAKSACNTTLVVSGSHDSGDTWYSRTLDMTQSQYKRGTKRLLLNMPQSQNFRFKIYNNKLDCGYSFYGLHSVGTMSDYRGK